MSDTNTDRCPVCGEPSMNLPPKLAEQRQKMAATGKLSGDALPCARCAWKRLSAALADRGGDGPREARMVPGCDECGMQAAGAGMSKSRLAEVEALGTAHSPIIKELVAEVRRLREREGRRQAELDSANEQIKEVRAIIGADHDQATPLAVRTVAEAHARTLRKWNELGALLGQRDDELVPDAAARVVDALGESERRQRLLADAIVAAAVRAGIVTGEQAMTGPEVLLVAEQLYREGEANAVAEGLKLRELVKAWIERFGVTDADEILGAADLVEELCKVVGWHESE